MLTTSSRCSNIGAVHTMGDMLGCLVNFRHHLSILLRLILYLEVFVNGRNLEEYRRIQQCVSDF